MRGTVALGLVVLSAAACGRTPVLEGLASSLDPSDAGPGGDRPGFGPLDVGTFPDTGFQRPDDGGRDTGVRPDVPAPRPDRPDGPDIGPRSDIGPRPDVGPDGGLQCAVDCESFSIPCVRVFCDPNTGGCARELLPEGSACDDGRPCTVDEFCQNGSCIGPTPVDCSSLNSPCTHGRCVDEAGGCVLFTSSDGARCEDGTSCTIGDSCLAGMCLPGAPTGACRTTSPIPIIVGSTQTVSGLRRMCTADDVQASCSPVSGPDTVFELVTDGPRRVRVSSLDPAMQSLTVQTQCGDPTTELACTPSAAAPRSVMVEAGSTFFSLDRGAAGFPSPPTLQVSIDAHDTCAAPVDVPLPAPGQSIDLRGTTALAHNELTSPMCGGNSGSNDHVYRLIVSQPSAVELRMVPPAGGRRYDATMYIFAGPTCAQGQPLLACDDDSAGNQQPLINITLQPGTYFVVVDGFGGNQQGEYLLRVTQRMQTLALTFPALGDARLRQVNGIYSQDGDFVEGARRPPIAAVGSANMDLRITNRLNCDSVDMAASINGVIIGTFAVQRGVNNLSLMMTFPPIAGPNYSIRYEVVRDVMAGCGGIDLPDGVSTLTLGP